ncbi:helix-turn-helix transcriptional regulator [Marinobacter sp. TBZ242]|uniref:Helix-turn-helix transcriptional regulator n=1 Tax=Marinobacter azerbaijanicus TaxID=3050455 RepID=A0ABT7ICJ0_9GAMM|nr:helix-turn-helix transcriptional regulator [Marinobacter sp. TBZ242]MDL0431517.1 helix-turn-helix transcriptional regulator [Marinobacter sp. TBZ242]
MRSDPMGPLAPKAPFSARVASLIAGHLERGRVGVEAVASQLHMSRHTLHKRLKQENLTFAALLEEIRRERALAYLKDRSKSLVEIAEQLGFSELSAFSRAFKRWMGKSPGAYRSMAA